MSHKEDQPKEDLIEDISEKQLRDEELAENVEVSDEAPTGEASLSEEHASEEVVVEEQVAEEVVEAKVLDTKAELAALCEGDETLSEEFKLKAATLFEAALKQRVDAETTKLEEQFQESLVEQVKAVREELIEKVDGYLNYVVEQWMEENQLAVDAGLRTEIAEGFIESLKSVFVENYIEVPESKVDLVDDLSTKVEALEEQLSKAAESEAQLRESLQTLQREKVLAEAAEGLAMTEVDKLKSLVEDFDFESEEAFAKKVAIVKESFFKKSSQAEEEIVEEALNEQTASPRMSLYKQAISRTIKK